MSNALMDKIELNWNEGFEKGIEEGTSQVRVASVENIHKKLGLSVQEACDVEEISVEEYKKLKALLEAEE